MIISHKYKFIFIKTRKTAGTSIEVFLAKQCGMEDVVTPIYPPVSGHTPRNFKGYFNPIGELIETNFKTFKGTLYDWKNKRKFFNHMPAYVVKNRVSPDIWQNYFKFCVERNPWDKTVSHYNMKKYRRNGDLTFFDYLKNGNYVTDYYHYSSPKTKKILVDKIFKKLGINYDGHLNENAKTSYKKSNLSYKDYYDNEGFSLIKKIFEKELLLLNYEF